METKKMIVLAMLFVVILGLVSQFESLNTYVRTVKRPYKTGAAETWPSINQNPHINQNELLLKIKQQAEKLYERPVNAVVDRVWKAIPGYNGLEVDIKKTYQLAKLGSQSSDLTFIYKEIAPQVNLDDLGPQPIYKGNPRKPMVAFMINVAWGNEYIDPILETLRKENVRATFFLDGSWLKNNIAVAKQIQEQGHELSNHAYSHKNMSRLGRVEAVKEIQKTEELLQKELGINNELFAPPSGDFDEETVQIAYELKLKTVLWTIDTVDWRKPAPEWILKRITSRLEPGAMILMHPTESSSRALEGIIDEIKRRGLVIGTVSELISPKRVIKVEATFDDASEG